MISTRKKKITLLAIIYGTLLILAAFYFTKEDKKVADTNLKPSKTSNVLKENRDVNQASQTRIEKLDHTVLSENSSLPSDQSKETSATEIFLQNQKKIKEDFKSKIRLQIPIASDIYFTEKTIPQTDVAILEGKTLDKKREMTLMATEGIVSGQMILDFLNENKNELSIMKGEPFKIDGEPQVMTPPKNSGFSGLTVVKKANSGPVATYAAFLTREDKLGTYLIIIRSDKSFFENNEYFFDELYDGIKAK